MTFLMTLSDINFESHFAYRKPL